MAEDNGTGKLYFTGYDLRGYDVRLFRSAEVETPSKTLVITGDDHVLHLQTATRIIYRGVYSRPQWDIDVPLDLRIAKQLSDIFHAGQHDFLGHGGELGCYSPGSAMARTGGALGAPEAGSPVSERASS